MDIVKTTQPNKLGWIYYLTFYHKLLTSIYFSAKTKSNK